MGWGIFFGLVFCGLIYLYTKTKDSPGWTKFARILIFLIYAIVIVITISIVIYFFNQSRDDKHQLITELKGVKLGESLEDATFKHGKFENIDVVASNYFFEKMNELRFISDGDKDKENEYEIAKREYEKSLRNIQKDLKNPPKTLELRNEVNNINIEITDNKITELYVPCNPDKDYILNVNGIYCDASGETITNKFGDDVKILCRIKDTRPDSYNLINSEKLVNYRTYITGKYGVTYSLKNNKVYGFSVRYPKDIEKALSHKWGACK